MRTSPAHTSHHPPSVRSRGDARDESGLTIIELLVTVLVLSIVAVAVRAVAWPAATRTARLSALTQQVDGYQQRLVAYGTNHDEGFKELTEAAAKELFGVSEIAYGTALPTATASGSVYTKLWVEKPSGTYRTLTVARCQPKYFTAGGVLCAKATVELGASGGGGVEGTKGKNTYECVGTAEACANLKTPVSTAEGKKQGGAGEWPGEPTA